MITVCRSLFKAEVWRGCTRSSGVNNIFSNQFWIFGLAETWIILLFHSTPVMFEIVELKKTFVCVCVCVCVCVFSGWGGSGWSVWRTEPNTWRASTTNTSGSPRRRSQLSRDELRHTETKTNGATFTLKTIKQISSSISFLFCEFNSARA